MREVVVASISIRLSVHREGLNGGSGLYPAEDIVEKPMLLDPCPPRRSVVDATSHGLRAPVAALQQGHGATIRVDGFPSIYHLLP